MSSTGRKLVYLVVRLDWDDQSVMSVWTSRELADAEVVRLKAASGHQSYNVDEHVLDEEADPW